MTGTLPHPHMPDVIPEPPEHVRPTAPDAFEEKVGCIWCVRCGAQLWNMRIGDTSPKPCFRQTETWFR